MEKEIDELMRVSRSLLENSSATGSGETLVDTEDYNDVERAYTNLFYKMDRQTAQKAKGTA